jgi:hypothetical protein
MVVGIGEGAIVTVRGNVVGRTGGACVSATVPECISKNECVDVAVGTLVVCLALGLFVVDNNVVVITVENAGTTGSPNGCVVVIADERCDGKGAAAIE